MDFKEVIKKRMEEIGINPLNVARHTGYSSAYIYDLLKGARRFNEESEKKICEYLGLEKVYIEKTS